MPCERGPAQPFHDPEMGPCARSVSPLANTHRHGSTSVAEGCCWQCLPRQLAVSRLQLPAQPRNVRETKTPANTANWRSKTDALKRGCSSSARFPFGPCSQTESRGQTKQPAKRISEPTPAAGHPALLARGPGPALQLPAALPSASGRLPRASSAFNGNENRHKLPPRPPAAPQSSRQNLLHFSFLHYEWVGNTEVFTWSKVLLSQVHATMIEPVSEITPMTFQKTTELPR